MRGAAHRALFAAGDGAEVMRASFSCPVCLGGVRTVHLADSLPVPIAELRCPACAAFWQVELELGHVLRLLTDRGSGLDVRCGPQAARMRDALALGEREPGL